MSSLRSQSSRHVLYINPDALRTRAETDSAWAETPEEVKAGIKWGRRKAELLRWVRRQMGRRLTPCERHCLELLFFGGLNYREVGRATGADASAVCRAVQRSIHKLRAAAVEDGLLPAPRRRRGAGTQNGTTRKLKKGRPSTR